MGFGARVKCFSCDGIGMVGNLDNGVVIGVDGESFRLCEEVSSEIADEKEILEKMPELFSALERGGFFLEHRPREGLDAAYLHVTHHCNLNCIGCYSKVEKRNQLSDLSFHEICSIIDALAAFGTKSLVISGGEPFLRSDLSRIVLYARGKMPEARITVLTNGIGVTKEQVESVANSVDCISVSLDGHSESCASLLRGGFVYQEAMRTISSIKDTPAEAHFIATIHGGNIGDVPRYTELAQSLGTTMNFSLLSCLGDLGDEDDLRLTDARLRQLAEEMLSGGEAGIDTANLGLGARASCGMGKSTVSIAADGTVYPCHMLHVDGYAMGNALKDDLWTILKSDKTCALCSLEVDQIAECAQCQYAYLCGGGCRARAAFDGDGLTHKDPYCALMKHYYSGLFAALSRMLNK